MSAQDLEVRRATAADAPALAQSRFRFRSETNASGPLPQGANLDDEAAFVARATRLLTGYLASGRWFAWIAGDEGTIAGHVFLQLVDKLPNPAPEEPERLAYLTSFYVQSDLRGGGVGTRLISALEEFAVECGVEKIVIVGTTPLSRTLYARRGYVSTADLLEKRLIQRSA